MAEEVWSIFVYRKRDKSLTFSLLLSFLHRQKQSFDIVEDYNLKFYLLY